MPRTRTLAIVNRDHLPLAAAQLAGLPADNVVVQPRNRDTGPGLLLPLLELPRRDPNATVAIFPSDHYLGNASAFRARVRRGAALVAAHPAKIVLLGTEPDWADPGYGYILPGEPVPGTIAGDAFGVRAFCEKPPAPIAERIVGEGALWNCFVTVCRVERLLALARALRPRDVARLSAVAGDDSALVATYANLPAWNFSADFLSHMTEHLLVLRASELDWSDWGTVASIERTLASLGRTPPWRHITEPATPQSACVPRARASPSTAMCSASRSSVKA